MLVGSFASGAYGEPRLTQDIDIVIDLRPEQARQLCAAFGQDQYYVSVEAAVEATRRRGQFNVIHPSSGNKIDFLIAQSDAWSRQEMSRRRRVRILPDKEGYAARPEDVIISKMQFYREGGSEKHLRDITGILKVSADDVDRDYVTRWAGSLGLHDIWQAVLRRLGEGGAES